MTNSIPVTISTSASASGPIDLSKLRETIDYIRPAVQADGGDLILLGVDEGDVNIQMVGACGGCPLSMMTLKAGIERILKDRVPGVQAVHASADAPGPENEEITGGIQIPTL